MTIPQTTWTVIAGIVLFSTTAHAEPAQPAPAPTLEKMKLQKKELGNMRPVHALGDIYLAGQPTLADLPLLKKHGIKTIITLRKTEEVRWDEAAAVQQQGMKYIQVPFQSPEELKPQVFNDLLKVLRDKKRGPTVLHCGSANRVGAIWYAHRVLDGKLSPEAAMKEAKIVGLRTPAFLQRARAYVEQVQKARKSLPAGPRPVK